MIEGMSSSPSDSLAARQHQSGVLVPKQGMEQERRLADTTSQQVKANTAAGQSSSNPQHMGQNVDTFA